MSSSPPKKGEAEAVEGDQTPDPSEQPKNQEGMDPSDAQGHDIEVKEQDRWLPIANGMCLLIATGMASLTCVLLRLPPAIILNFLALLIRRCDLLCDNWRSNHDSAHSHFGEQSKAIGESRAAAEAQQPIIFNLYYFHW